MLVVVWGLLNSSISELLFSLLPPTLNCNPNEIALVPMLEYESVEKVEELVIQLRVLSQFDWDSQETSWDFKRNALV